MAITVLSAAQGAVLAIAHADGTANVWSIPTNATITIQDARGFGNTAQTSNNVSLSNAESDIDGQLVHDGVN